MTMATELSCILLFEDVAPAPEQLERMLDCDVLEYVEEEV